MRKRLAFVLGVAVVVPVAVGLPSVAEPTGVDALKVDLDGILADRRLAGAQTGVVVRDPATGETLYSRQSDYRVQPASNAKLLTAAAAMQALGPDFRFRTEALAGGERQGSTLNGDLYLRGSGDPTMLAADYDRLAADVAAAGIRTVQGKLLADDTAFDSTPLGPGWAWDDEPYYYSAPVSALNAAPNTDYDAGSAIVQVSPTTPGAPADARLDPGTGVLSLDNRVTTTAGGTPQVTVQRDHHSGHVLLTGTIPAGAEPTREWVPVLDGTAYATDLFARALAAHGVRVQAIGKAATPPGSGVLATHDSMPLRDLLVPFLKLSNNGHAEALVKAMGRQRSGVGSWDTAIPVVADQLRGLGVNPDVLHLADGSGLSRMDSVVPDQLATLLDNVRDKPWFPDFDRALPVAGVPDRMVGGTLRNRMGGTPAANNVHAKTGSMTGVDSLSGYVTAADGRPLVFSLIFNDFLGEPPEDLEDAIAIRLATYNGAADKPGRTQVPRRQNRVADDPRTPVDERDLECSWVKRC